MAKSTIAAMNQVERYTSSRPRYLMIVYVVSEYRERYSSAPAFCFMTVPNIEPKAIKQSRNIASLREDKNL
jgi:hypothetical protein